MRTRPRSGPAIAPRRRRWRVARVACELAVVAAAIAALALWCSVPNTASLATENPTTTAFIELRREQAAAAGRPFELQWRWRPIARISRYLRAAIIYAEDYNFYRHEGVDWDAIEAAVDANWDKGALAIGGSTITQQLAKNLYLSPSRSLVRKLRELLIAQSLEDDLTKQRILELYLNVVEWGDGVFGAEAAAQHWFGHSAQQLTPAEAVRLAIALPNPFKRAPNVRRPELTRKAVRLVHLLRLQGLIDAAQEREALDQVGAPDERVLRSRKRPRSGQPASGAPPRESTPPPATPPPPREEDTAAPPSE
jgi:monofunctional biosynthetic peptidoglycan transglycosylase